MGKVLVAYISRTGNTQKMADFIAEGLRIGAQTVDLKKVTDIRDEKDLKGYDGYLFGCPTYHRDMTNAMKTFLFVAEKQDLAGKIGGAFCSFTHSGELGPMIFDTMQYVYKMEMVNLGALNLKEQAIGTQEGIKACQDYGKAVAEKIG